MMSEINQLTSLYHAHLSLYDEDLPFWEQIVRMYGTPVLELGCGTGRVLLHLAAKGFQVAGVENNPASVAFLISLSQQSSGPKPVIHIADMCSLALEHTFNLIILPCNTYSMFAERERKKILQGVWQHLALDGHFVLSLPNPVDLMHLPARSDFQLEDTFNHPKSGRPVEVNSAWRKYSGKMIVRWQYNMLSPDGQIEQYGFKAQHYLVDRETYQQEFAEAGFIIESVFGDFKLQETRDDSPNLIFALRKRDP